MSQELKQYKRIILCGDGWGAIAVYKGLSDFFLPVFVQTNDEELRSMANREMTQQLSQYSDELLLFAGYKPIVPKEVLEKNTCINIHYSLLPAYRGFHSTVWAILNDEPYLGATIHLMSQYIDDGPIIYQYRVENDFVSTSYDYMNMFNKKVTEVISGVLSDYINGIVVPVEQDKSNASWVGKRNEKDCQIDFTKPISYQKAFFRALVSPYPLPYIVYKQTKYIVTEVAFHPSDVVTHIGRILNIDADGLWVKVLDGYMIIKGLLDESGNKIDVSGKFKIGQYLITKL